MSTLQYPKVIVSLFVVAGLVGCASNTHRVAVLSLDDVNAYTVDCKHKDEQLEFLRTQIHVLKTVSFNDAGYMVSGVGQFVSAQKPGAHRERAFRTRGHHQAVIYEKINYLNLNC
jgi:hypothetical protein